MNLIKNLKTIYSWNKFEFWMLNLFNLCGGLFILLMPKNYLIAGAFIVIGFVAIFSFQKAMSFFSGSAADQHQFSWKYLQSLPMTRKELLHLMITSSLMTHGMYIFWCIAYSSTLFEIFDIKADHPLVYFKGFIAVLLFSLLSELFSIHNMIHTPRVQFAKRDDEVTKKNALVRILQVVLVGTIIYLYSPSLLYLIEEHPTVAENVLLLLKLTFNFWGFCFIAVLGVIALYNSCLEKWVDEKKSYPKLSPNLQYSYAKLAAGFALVLIGNNFLDKTPAYYSGSKLHNAVYSGDIKRVQKEIYKGANVNLENKFGATPIMVAANQGQLKIFNLLKDNGAKFSGEFKLEDKETPNRDIFYLAVYGGNAEIIEQIIQSGEYKKVYEGYPYAPFHVAAVNCRTKVIEKLIEHKFDIGVLNKNESTPLHLAAKSKCFESTMLLVEAGADLMKKNKDGKMPIDLLPKNSNSSVSFYLEKKTRSPASIKN